MKFKKRITAVAVAIIMAVSTMALTASAKATSRTESTNYLSLQGITTYGKTADGIIYGYATSKVTNKTHITRYACSQADIYDHQSAYVTQSYRSGNVGYGQTLDSNTAKAVEEDCDYAKVSGVLYNGQETTMGGQYDSHSFLVNFS